MSLFGAYFIQNNDFPKPRLSTDNCGFRRPGSSEASRREIFRPAGILRGIRIFRGR